MGDALRPVTKGRLYEQVVDRLRAHAQEAGLTAGSRLPAERDLAARLGVSRASVAQAIVALEVQGLVETRHGGGVYLRRDSLDGEPYGDLVTRRRLLPDVLDARDALETKLAALAAGRRTDADLAAMEDALRVMREQVAAGEPPEEGDRLFHGAVVAAARSRLLAAFYDEIRDRIAESRHESLRQPGRPEQSLADHEAVLAAIRRGDAAGAAAAMHEHVDHVSRVRLLSWDPEA
ncbi:FadR/GntR family transcriptional regulator [Lapillicoccus jejuensis]|uniref:GntR family transcriptional regulator n=1 Tax=Lapillicoccus jejuensis TaxID=402171 RepID=A0A542E1N0_9MICO|nr:FCD domain-containing protein [Lapillicoccus jejuensis]TQJ09247.1 GntR family transcriptional regulator [Lapillicoccus jejuensis]